VFGTGYLGATHAAGMAELGHEVLGVDIDPGKVAKLAGGDIPFYEPGLRKMLSDNLAAGRLHFTTDYDAAAEFAAVHFLGVGTPQKKGEYGADLRHVHAVIDTLVPKLQRSAVIVGKSTVPVGTAMALEERLRRSAPAGDAVEVAWNPEFLREAYAVEDTLRPDRLVFGTNSRHALDLLEEIYAIPITDRTPVVRCDIATSELIKVAANAFLATKISFINAMAQMCQAAGGDVILLADALGHDKRIGREFLNAGLGFGGGCLPKDIAALAVRAEELGVDVLSDFIRSVEAINAGQRAELAELAIDQAGGSVAGKRIAVLGAAFKPGTDDTRNSPALTVADQLHASGADVRIYDPQARLPPREGFTQVASVEQALLGAEVVLHLTEWPEFRQLDPERLGTLVASKVIIDGRLKLHAPTWRNAGWKLVQIGRATTL
jgi:UDPglucose 6-dehydrogenase